MLCYAIVRKGHVQKDLITDQLEIYESYDAAILHCPAGAEIKEVDVLRPIHNGEDNHE